MCNKKKENFYLLIITSESSIIEQFSLEFILRRFDGDAPSTIIDTELARLAVGVKVIGLIVVCCCWSLGKPFFVINDFFLDTFFDFSSLGIVSSVISCSLSSRWRISLGTRIF